MPIILGVFGLFFLSKVLGSGRRRERDLRQIKRALVPMTAGEHVKEVFAGIFVMLFWGFMLYIVIMANR